MSENASPEKSSERRLLLARLLALVFVIAITAYVLSIDKEQAKELEKFGYPGIFLLSILANATIILPAPGVLFTFSMGAVFNPFWVAIAAGLGASLGELSGYLAGFSGQAIVENAKFYERIRGWMESNQLLSYLIITVLAFIPNPAFDLAGMASGTLRIPVQRFLFFCAIGKIFKMLAFAYAGAYLTDLFNI